MIQTEYMNGGTLIRHYSDAGYMLKQVETGLLYPDPVDLVPCPHTYIETDIPVDPEENVEPDTPETPETPDVPGESISTEELNALKEKAMAYDIIMGVSE